MTQRELLSWEAFYREHPFSDSHRYHRPAALVSQSMSGGDMGGKLDWLRGQYKQQHVAPIIAGNFSDADLRTFAALGLEVPQRDG